MPPVGRGRGRGRGRGAAVAPPPRPFLFSPAGRSVPVILSVGLGGAAGPADPFSLVGVPTDSGLVARLRFVRWLPPAAGPDGVNRVALASCHMMRLFLSRCQVGPSAADRQAAGQASVFTGRLSADAWSRILSTFVDNGLLDQPCHTLDLFEQSLANLIVVDPTPLQLLATDWVPADAFVVPAAAADQELHDRMAYLRFLNLASVAFLEDKGRPAQPLRAFCYLAGAVGPCYSQPARENELGPMHFIVQRLRDHVCARTVPDAQAAFGLKRLLPDLVLPAALRALTIDQEELSAELLDAIEYVTPARRAVVEQRRLYILGARLSWHLLEMLDPSLTAEPSRRSMAGLLP